ncbi:MAG: metal-dependent transcriptional regulator [Candidatus Krumholzibacteriales bacterium]
MLSSSSEDYIETIFLLESEGRVVRVKDIGKKLGVSLPSVNQALAVLKKKKLIEHEKYGYVELTERGREVGEQIYNRHEILLKFLTEILEVPEKVAEEEACRIEHYIGSQTHERLKNFIGTVLNCPHSNRNCSERRD